MIRWDKNKEINEADGELSKRLLRKKWNHMETYSHASWSFDVENKSNELYSYEITRIVIKIITIAILTSVT